MNYSIRLEHYLMDILQKIELTYAIFIRLYRQAPFLFLLQKNK